MSGVMPLLLLYAFITRKGKNYLLHTDEEESIIQPLQTKLSALRSLHIAVLKGGPATRNTISHGCFNCYTYS